MYKKHITFLWNSLFIVLVAFFDCVTIWIEIVDFCFEISINPWIKAKYIFAQLTDFLPRRVFDRIVKKNEGNKYVRSFACWNQMLCMVFGQLTSRDSMRDLMLSLEAYQPKFYHLGFGSTITRRNLGKANERSNYRAPLKTQCWYNQLIVNMLIDINPINCLVLQYKNKQ